MTRRTGRQDEPLDAPTPERRREAWRTVLAGPSPARTGPLDRRDFLRRAGAAMALAGLGACTRAPHRKILPYVDQPPEVTPGVSSRYATAMAVDGYGVGLLVESHEGRPTKVEGNPHHPASLGATGALEQASVLSLYDPFRIAAVRRQGAPSTWNALHATLAEGRWTRERGRGLFVVMEPTSSPSLAMQLDALRARFPEARLHFHTALPRRAAREGARIAFGEPLERRLDLRAAEVIVALDDDLLAAGPAHLRHARHFAERRREPLDRMSRLYVVEPAVTPTGMSADHRLAVRRSDVAAIAAALLDEIAGERALGAVRGRLRRALEGAPPGHIAFVRAMARDLLRHGGASVVVTGDAQPPEVHAAVLAANEALGSFGRTIAMAPSPVVAVDAETHDPTVLARALEGGEVEHLVVIGTDVVYAAPADVPLGPLLSRAKESLYVGAHFDATAAACGWVAPLAHDLESWGDTRAFDGTAAIVQPLIAPIRPARTPLELLAMLVGQRAPEGYLIVRDAWKRIWAASGASFERRWERALADGVVAGTELPEAKASFSWPRVERALGGLDPRIDAEDAPLELTLMRDPRLHDGRAADNAWLLELPDPVTKLTWENAAQLAPETARRLAIRTGDLVSLELGGRRLEVPAIVVPGQAEGTVALAIGWGRRTDPTAPGYGVRAFGLATARAWHAATGASVAPLGRRRPLPVTQPHHELPSHERAHAIFRHEELDAYRSDPAKVGKKRHLPQLYQNLPSGEHQWAMTVDLSACTGCSVCVVACQAENNVPVVGAEGVVKSRAMHWLRIDTYQLEGSDAYAPQPMLCQHCEMAPCEYVCPVNATVHSGDGLNEMIYNRCVGTRFCSNNCPYKVRRFNWFDYHEGEPALAHMVRNPDVTVRARGVMEKCTFCVQRIREAEIRAESTGRSLEDGDVVTACQQACPTRAIVFGDMKDERSEVSRLRGSPRAYGALEELGTRPRVQYLARIRNRNEELP